jgi:hypothetical protein
LASGHSGQEDRTFIREALEAAISEFDAEDAERPEIEQDTEGVLGSSPIADTIFKKIRNAKVAVADITLTAQRPRSTSSRLQTEA